MKLRLSKTQENQFLKLRKLCQSFASKVREKYGLKVVIQEITEHDIEVSLYSPKGNIFLGSMITNMYSLGISSVDGIMAPVEPFSTLFAECSNRFEK